MTDIIIDKIIDHLFLINLYDRIEKVNAEYLKNYGYIKLEGTDIECLMNCHGPRLNYRRADVDEWEAMGRTNHINLSFNQLLNEFRDFYQKLYDSNVIYLCRLIYLH